MDAAHFQCSATNVKVLVLLFTHTETLVYHFRDNTQTEGGNFQLKSFKVNTDQFVKTY